MAQKRIRMARSNVITDKVRLLYDDGSWGEIDMAQSRNPVTQIDELVGLTLKQAKMRLGIKK